MQKRALESYAHRVKHYVGAYAAQLNGVDLVVLTGGIGENNIVVREMCFSDLDFLGITFDKNRNQKVQGKIAKICKRLFKGYGHDYSYKRRISDCSRNT